MAERTTDLASLRAQIAEGCRAAAQVYQANSHLRGAADLATRLRSDAVRNEALAAIAKAEGR